MAHTRRTAGRASIALAAVALLIAGAPGAVPPAAAEPSFPAGATPAAPAAPPVLPDVPPGTYQITLITGDRVELVVEPGGRYETSADDPTRFQTEAGPDGVYMYPEEALPAVQRGLLDPELFHVSYLAANGYADAATGRLPVILTYPRPAGPGRAAPPAAEALADRADRLPATAAPTGLTSVNGAGVGVDKDTAGQFWQQLTGGATAAGPVPIRALDQGVAKVWLDRRVTVTLDESVPLVGAPEAWQAGLDGTGVTVAVLDTGIDDTHPDLAGTVVAAKSFVPGVAEVADGHGHGTHVAATIAGSGAAADGSRPGVAPGAQLAIGKVLSDAGSGSATAIIAGMEWAAAEQDADIVSISLGGGPTDGTDILSQAVNDLTASTGALFVIAAGNDGPAAETVATPGAASAALTVAATDKQDQVASFSSRGPRTEDLALKPDIAAPGVGIVAARAAGTSMGTPVDEHYTRANGTSMATPHVAGAAALLAQRHPDWPPGSLKAALMSTATDVGQTVYDRGAGRLDAARAVRQQVVAGTANLDYGLVETSESDPSPPLSRQVAYRNLTDQPVTLALAPSLAARGGGTAPDGALTTDPAVTVPAGRHRHRHGHPRRVRSRPGQLLRRGHRHRRRDRHPADHPGRAGPRTPEGHPHHPHPRPARCPDRSPAGGSRRLAWGLLRVRDLCQRRGRARSALGHGRRGRGRARRGADPRRARHLQPSPGGAMVGRRGGGLRRGSPVQPAGHSHRGSRGHARRPSGGAGGVPHPRTRRRDHRPDLGRPAHRTHDLGWQALHQHLLGPLRHPNRAGQRGHLPGGHHARSGQPAAQCQRDRAWPVRPAPGVALLRRPGLRPRRSRRRWRDPDRRLGAVPGRHAPARAGRRRLRRPRRPGRARSAGQAGAGAVGRRSAQRRRGGRQDLDRSDRQRPRGRRYRRRPVPQPAARATTRLVLRRAGSEDRSLAGGGGAGVRHPGHRGEAERGAPPAGAAGRRSSDHRGPVGPEPALRLPPAPHVRPADPRRSAVHLRPDEPGPGRQHHPLGTAAGTGAVRHIVLEAGHLHEQPSDGEVRRAEAQPHRVLRSARLRRGLHPPVVTGVRSQGGAPSIRPADPDQRTAPCRALCARRGGRGHRRDGVPSAARRVQPLQEFCDMCRQGDTLLPSGHLTAGGGDYRGQSADLTIARLFTADGTEIPRVRRDLIPVFHLPPEPGQYRLVQDRLGVASTWTFNSATPQRDTVHPWVRCWGPAGWTEPCHPEPFVFLRYDLGDQLRLDNTVPAGPVNLFEVTAYHNPQSTVDMPGIAGLRLWTSTDGGEQWRPVLVVPRRGAGGERTFTAIARYLDQPGAAVSLRAEAWDQAGNRIEQTVRDAFTLSSRG